MLNQPACFKRVSELVRNIDGVSISCHYRYRSKMRTFWNNKTTRFHWFRYWFRYATLLNPSRYSTRRRGFDARLHSLRADSPISYLSVVFPDICGLLSACAARDDKPSRIREDMFSRPPASNYKRLVQGRTRKSMGKLLVSFYSRPPVFFWVF